MGPQVAMPEAFFVAEAAKNIQNNKKLLQGPNTKVPMPQLTQMVCHINSQQRKMLGVHYQAGEKLDSESVIHALQALSGIPSTGFYPTGQQLLRESQYNHLDFDPEWEAKEGSMIKTYEEVNM